MFMDAARIRRRQMAQAGLLEIAPRIELCFTAPGGGKKPIRIGSAEKQTSGHYLTVFGGGSHNWLPAAGQKSIQPPALFICHGVQTMYSRHPGVNNAVRSSLE
jgi:hypothetical protein